MSRKILERYRRNAGGQLTIDISASKVADLYDDFDKRAPYIKKELDYDLVEYLIDSAREVGAESFRVHFAFAEPVSVDLQERLRKSIRNYFDYLLESSRRDILKVVRSSLILVAAGLTMLAIITYFRLSYNLDDSVLEGVLSEGVVIASWVAVWEGVEALLMNGPSLFNDRKIYRLLINADLDFSVGSESQC